VGRIAVFLGKRDGLRVPFGISNANYLDEAMIREGERFSSNPGMTIESVVEIAEVGLKLSLSYFLLLRFSKTGKGLETEMGSGVLYVYL
jgi:hypothetical protein